ncbi:neuropeptide FF receptor 1 [Nematostella vectensis]|uniref:neuropeptide FF receptor 1 n=1 Tax=Nematostella vectensis TaxID=45351 RepID=UPI00138FCCFB|nr:neuropeptide FF receptor 1 [Nematostella vectensis]
MSPVEGLLLGAFCLLLVPNTVFNTLVCMVVRRSKRAQTPMNNLIMSLAMSDIFIGATIFPRHIINNAFVHPGGKQGSALCKLVTGGGLLWISVTASGLLLTAVAFERFFAIVLPHKKRLRITNRKLRWIVSSVWMFAIASNLPSMLVMEYNEDLNFCTEVWPVWVSPKAYVSVMFVVGTSSVLFMYILYSVVLLTFWKKRHTTTEMSQCARLRARTKVTKMLILMTVIHTVCRTPNYTFYLLSYINPDVQYGSASYSSTVALILLNSTSHPFLLCWQMESFRKGVWQILQSLVCRHRVRSVAYSGRYQVRNSTQMTLGDAVSYI